MSAEHPAAHARKSSLVRKINREIADLREEIDGHPGDPTLYEGMVEGLEIAKRIVRGMSK